MKWDRLFLVVLGNILIAMAIISLIENGWAGGFWGVLSVGIISHIHYWRGGRFIVRLSFGGKG